MQARVVKALGILGMASVVLSGCGGTTPPAHAPAPGPVAKNVPANPGAIPPRSEVPADRMAAVFAAHLKGLGHMERYTEYPQAVEAFRTVHELAPDWIPGSINLAIALLNTTGVAAEASKNQGRREAEPATADHFDEALGLLAAVLEREPENLHARYCRGIIHQYLGDLTAAHADFRYVTEHDPSDAHAWYKLASTLPAPESTDRQARLEQANRQIPLLKRALECNPYLVPALYQLMMAHGLAGQREDQQKLLDLWRKLNPQQNSAAPGEMAETVYGEMGKYARIIDWAPPGKDSKESPVSPPRFAVPERIDVALPAGDRWANASNFAAMPAALANVLTRWGAAITVFDANHDGALDLMLSSSVVGSKGLRDALLINKGDGSFEDATNKWGLPSDRGSITAAAGDFDADGLVDLALTGVDGVRLLRNAGTRFEDVTDRAGLASTKGAMSLAARWLDLDQDGDLDLYIINHGEGESGASNRAFRNDGQPPPIAGRPKDNWAPSAVAPPDLSASGGLSVAFTPWAPPGSEALAGGGHRHTGLAWLDLDGDRDLDLLLTQDDALPIAVLNDRLGRFHAESLADLVPQGPTQGTLAADFDADGRTDLALVPQKGRVTLWRNREPKLGEPSAVTFEFYPTDAHDWLMAQAIDLDLDGATDLLGLPTDGPAPIWARNTGGGLKSIPLALGPDSTSRLVGLGAADLLGDPLPDLVLVRDGEGPYLARNLGNGHHWMSLGLTGRWKTNPDRARTNPHGWGAKVQLQGANLRVVHDHVLAGSGLAQSVLPIVVGLGPSTAAQLIRITWPDGVMQCELEQNGDQALALPETNRKTGSCPVLFAWNGDRFVCIGDFLGGGGLGYLVAPGVYGQPDRDEAVLLRGDQLQPERGAFRLSITEPMDEVAYLDQVRLDVIDRPAGVEVAPDERFAPGGNRPSGALLSWSKQITPVRVLDLKGKDVTDSLRDFDRRTADGFALRSQWVGYAEPHGIVLDFGDRLRDLGPGDRLVLGLAGWVEYPYSQTNYAAATAGIGLQPPILERLKDDGTWEVLEPDPGYPAGLPRLTTLELTGKLGGDRCVLRLRTNMECYWDQAFIAVLDPANTVRVTTLDITRASLGARGYSREVSPDGREPLLYDYNHVDPAPLARFTGALTRYGDVAPLLRQDDDQFCVVGPGDEVRLEIDTGILPSLPEGWARSYVLRTVGYCKDADPFTATSDTVGPLPWRGMGPFPFATDGERPRDAAYQRYLNEYQTRQIGP